jgi:hypothetical protein
MQLHTDPGNERNPPMTENTAPADDADQDDAEAGQTEAGHDDADQDDAEAGQTEAGHDDAEAGDQGDADDAETFPRSYVERLRRENKRYREQAGHADTYARRLHTELVRATGRLADPTDLPFDADHLADADQLDAAITALLDAKPHLAARRPAGDIGQGNRGTAGSFSLLDTLRARV